MKIKDEYDKALIGGLKDHVLYVKYWLGGGRLTKSGNFDMRTRLAKDLLRDRTL